MLEDQGEGQGLEDHGGEQGLESDEGGQGVGDHGEQALSERQMETPFHCRLGLKPAAYYKPVAWSVRLSAFPTICLTR